MNEERLIRRDRMRFKKNKLSANLALLAIIFDVIYFVSIYQSDVGNYFYTYMIGISIIYNLVFLLAAFLTEEGSKNYKRNHSYVMALLGIGQIIRIFIIPMQGHSAVVKVKSGEQLAISNGKFVLMLVMLIASAVCLFVGAVVNYVKCSELEAHMKMLEEQSAAGAMAQKSA